MIITIGGDAGSGKSTVAQALAKKLNYKYYSVGNLRRQIAAARGMTIEEYNKLGETDPSTDKEADEYQTKLAKEDNFVLESRLGWKFVPKSLKIFLTVDENTAAERIFKDHKAGKRPSEKPMNSVKDAIKEIQERRKSDLLRYKKYYGITNHLDTKHYDIVVDTTGKTIEQVADEILIEIKKRK